MSETKQDAPPVVLPTKSRSIIWQGWELSIPRRWDPAKLNGNYTAGYALFADALKPRLGLRWYTPKSKRPVPGDVVQDAVQQEVGQLAAAEARAWKSPSSAFQAGSLYLESQPPGRDIWTAYSAASGRLIQLAYHAQRREHVLSNLLLPTLREHREDRAMPWSIFDLSCVVPAGMRLKKQRLNAGDLGLTFADSTNEVTVRQIALASLALKRFSLDGWISEEQFPLRKFNRPVGVKTDITVRVGSYDLPGRRGRMERRRRFAILRWRPAEFITYAVHDKLRDRVVIVQGNEESLVREIAGTVGLL